MFELNLRKLAMCGSTKTFCPAFDDPTKYCQTAGKLMRTLKGLACSACLPSRHVRRRRYEVWRFCERSICASVHNKRLNLVPESGTQSVDGSSPRKSASPVPVPCSGSEAYSVIGAPAAACVVFVSGRPTDHRLRYTSSTFVVSGCACPSGVASIASI